MALVDPTAHPHPMAGERMRVETWLATISGETATVTYVSNQPEFTPPVIYSLENRQKLVYLIEARPDPGAEIGRAHV